jgi:hypothetical protein
MAVVFVATADAAPKKTQGGMAGAPYPLVQGAHARPAQPCSPVFASFLTQKNYVSVQ